MSGVWIFICGPSGVGKDSVIALARDALSKCADIVFARRMVSRPVQPGSDHDAMDEAGFISLQKSGGMCWHWQAHGFYYGIAQHYADDVQAGRTVVVNGSRDHVSKLQDLNGVRLVEITASPDRLAERLAQRGRDSSSAITERLARNALLAEIKPDLLVVNDTDIAAAGVSLTDYLLLQASKSESLTRSSTRA